MAKQDRVFTDLDKHKRAEDVYLILTGKKPRETGMSPEHREHLLSRFTDFLAEEEIDLKKTDKEEVVAFIYGKLGGMIRSSSQEKKVKKSAKKNAIGTHSEEDGDDESDKDESDDEEGE